MQVLLGGAALTSRILYACKYTTKPQKEANAATALIISVASYSRLLERQDAEAQGRSLTESEIRKKRLTNILYNTINPQEIPSTLASLYLLRGSRCYKSHDSHVLNFGRILTWVQSAYDNQDFMNGLNDEVTSASLIYSRLPKSSYSTEDITDDDDENNVDIVETQGKVDSTYTIVKPLDDYLYRPPILERLSLYEMHMVSYRRKLVQMSKSNSSTAEASHSKSKCIYPSQFHPYRITSYTEDIETCGFCKARSGSRQLGNFLPEHPLYLTHCLSFRKRHVVPILIGPKIPDISNVVDKEILEAHARMALILFKPFRCIQMDLLHPFATWEDAFNEWELPPRVLSLLQNSYDYQ